MNCSSREGINIPFLNISTLNHTLAVGETYNVLDVLRDVCSQFDSQIALSLMIFMTCYVLIKLMLPYAWIVIKDYMFMFGDYVDKGFKLYTNVTEYIMLLACVYPILIMYQSGMSTGFKVWIYVLVGIMLITQIMFFMRNRREPKNRLGFNEVLDKFKTMLDETEYAESEDKKTDGNMGN